MFYSRNCANSVLIMPGVMALNMTGKFNIEKHDISTDEGKIVYIQFKKLIMEKTKKDEATPTFVDIEKKEAIYAKDFESLLEWLEPMWWEKYSI